MILCGQSAADLPFQHDNHSIDGIFLNSDVMLNNV